MGKIWIKEFTGGLDTRRMPETTAGGVLVVGRDGHVTRGGEFEKRPAFVSEFVLPVGKTRGLAYGAQGIFVFGHEELPVGMPVGVNYQRLQHPDGVTALVSVPSFDLFSGKIYAVGEFADGSRNHFYDGVRIADWFDGRARASFRVISGGGSAVLSGLTVNGVAIIGSSVAWNTNSNVTAADIAAAVTSHTSAPDYTAVAVGDTVVIVAADSGSGPNGFPVNFVTANGFVVDPGNGLVLANGGGEPIAGVAAVGSFVITAGTANAANRVDNVKVDNVTITNAAVTWATSHAATAAAVASSINAMTSSPDYSAVADGAKVVITAVTKGSAINGKSVAVTVAGNVVASSIQAMAGGVDAVNTFQPGPFVKTVGSKMYSTSGPNLHFSGIKSPTRWTTDNTGAGAIDMSSHASGSENLNAIAKYQQFIAIFAGRVIQTWYVDPDPSLNKIAQVLNNTGTESPRSVTQFGDNDLFYLDESGVRSLRARDASNSAATEDIGSPIDDLVTAKLKTLSPDERLRVIGLIEPSNGRFWLIMNDDIFVFSFFRSAKVSAWSTYSPGINIEDAVVFRRKVYLRSNNNIFVFGGLADDIVYDSTEAEAWLPFLDANDPTREKSFTGIDLACTGVWEAAVAFDPRSPNVQEIIANADRTTYAQNRLTGVGKSTHISLRLKSKGSGPAKLGAAVIHYEGDADEDK